jgi:hypothetical protein
MVSIVLCGCGGLPDVVTDTGYQGTWRRGNERTQSELAIVEHEGEYRMRLSRTTSDRQTNIRCDWSGNCEEFVEGMKTSEYKFRVWIDEERGNLRLECKGQVFEPAPLDVHYIHELVVMPKGHVLKSYTVLDADGTYEFKKGPRRRLHKVSDHVTDPPDGWSPPAGG